jgi:predicted lipoprotein with Yx(FWY)xxD motif
MASFRGISAALVLIATFVAACTTSGGASTTAPVAGNQAPASAGTGGVTVASATSPSLGTYLTGANGLTLYTHAGDGPTSSTCTGDCATTWPPLTVATGEQPTAGAGVTGKLTTLTRADGSTQVAYEGLPLYYWQADTKPGDTTGDGVNGFSVAKVGGAAPASSSSGRYGY